MPNPSLYKTKGYIPILSAKSKKYLMVKKAKNIETRKPMISERLLRYTSELTTSRSKKTKAPKIVGIPSIKENFDASFKLKPINKAAVIAVPDLEAPGSNAKT